MVPPADMPLADPHATLTFFNVRHFDVYDVRLSADGSHAVVWMTQWAMTPFSVVLHYLPDALIILTALLCLWIAYKAFRYSRAPALTGRVHCGKCDYDLGTSASHLPRCPECGKDHPRHSRIRILRRLRPQLLLAAVWTLPAGVGLWFTCELSHAKNPWKPPVLGIPTHNFFNRTICRKHDLEPPRDVLVRVSMQAPGRRNLGIIDNDRYHMPPPDNRTVGIINPELLRVQLSQNGTFATMGTYRSHALANTIQLFDTRTMQGTRFTACLPGESAEPLAVAEDGSWVWALIRADIAGERMTLRLVRIDTTTGALHEQQFIGPDGTVYDATAPDSSGHATIRTDSKGNLLDWVLWPGRSHCSAPFVHADGEGPRTLTSNPIQMYLWGFQDLDWRMLSDGRLFVASHRIPVDSDFLLADPRTGSVTIVSPFDDSANRYGYPQAITMIGQDYFVTDTGRIVARLPRTHRRGEIVRSPDGRLAAFRNYSRTNSNYSLLLYDLQRLADEAPPPSPLKTPSSDAPSESPTGPDTSPPSAAQSRSPASSVP